ncbi:lipid-A-disaccharide synthase [Fulvivirga sp. RKSG066]|uniref:lipid-A-disaccharide synthase n=1 Tax=Fulvivirga aurantia TaxID=2529383 RepID=UPI0012BC342E|nr:lipid-A-disaccharide synthase [Fulvivirga aurantia]MTI21294.1 lipid-A-disaccharide synthase [Fulvivirga aurantia]
MKYFIIAGERSGDLHGGNLVKAIIKEEPDSEFKGFGGDNMQASGVEILLHYKQMAFMGFIEVLQNIFKIRGFINQCKSEIDTYKPDAIILIDYGGFNMKIAKYAKKSGIPVHFYISPKVWAWNQKRALKLKRIVDFMYVILPFEKEFFAKFVWEVNYVGNPVMDAVKSHKPTASNLPSKYVALLPGSRGQELKNMLPYFIELASRKTDINFAVATVNNLDDSYYAEISKMDNVVLFKGNSYDLLSGADAAVVTSGTATLETALWKVPQVVVYRTSKISYTIAKRLIRVPYISLVNLIADKEVVKELIQDEFNTDSLAEELDRLLTDTEYLANIKLEYDKIIKTLDVGSASENTAKLIVENQKKASSVS